MRKLCARLILSGARAINRSGAVSREAAGKFAVRGRAPFERLRAGLFYGWMRRVLERLGLVLADNLNARFMFADMEKG